MCVVYVQVVNPDNGKGVPFLGDNQYHNYTIEWHTGDSSIGGNTTNSYVNYYIDGIYLGTNNVFVPTRGVRLWVSLWPTSDAQYVIGTHTSTHKHSNTQAFKHTHTHDHALYWPLATPFWL